MTYFIRDLKHKIQIFVNILTSNAIKLISPAGSGCGSVGRVVASEARDPWFKYGDWQNFKNELIYQE